MVNAQKSMEKILENIKLKKITSDLLLHVCCAPCGSYVLDYLSNYFSNISCFFYNPNIYPESEYKLRLLNLENLVEQLKPINGNGDIKILNGDYDLEKFYSVAEAYSNEPEGGKRCYNCIKLRLEETAKVASEEKFDYFATTLTVSPHKNATMINDLAENLSQKYNVKYLPSDFKKKDGFKKSILLSKKFNLYRQNYCGCEYSIR